MKRLVALLAMAAFVVPVAGAQSVTDSMRVTVVPAPEGKGATAYRPTFRLRRAWDAPPPDGLEREDIARIMREELAALGVSRGVAEADDLGDIARLDSALARLEAAVARLGPRGAPVAVAPRSRLVPRGDSVALSGRPQVDRWGDRLDLRRNEPRDPRRVPVIIAQRIERSDDRTVEPPVAPAVAPTLDPADPRVPPRVELGPVTVAEVERAILETGLFRTSRVPFEFGESTLLPEAERLLDAVGDVLLRYPAIRIEVSGHTDAVSSDAFNLRLSGERAGSVAAYLVGVIGIAPERLEAAGYGEALPIATNETETGRALNRRVEFRVLNPDGAIQERESQRPADDDLRERLRELLRDELREAERDGRD